VNLEILHRTTYRYSLAPRRMVQTLRLIPSDSAHQRVLHWQVKTVGDLQAQLDAWGNPSHLMTCEQPSMRMVCESGGRVETFGCAELIDPAGPPPWFYLRDSVLAASHAQMLGMAQAALGAALRTESDALKWGRLLALAAAVTQTVRYESGHTDVGTSALQALQAGRGVCQDHAHVFIAACRSTGLAARYVSGYFHAQGAEFLSSHAWAEVCVDELARRWFSIDITHICPIDERHVRLAVGPDYAACPPVTGVRSGGGTERLEVQVEIRQI
jgi:transglutaminase-like putative cysteine protease